MRKKKNVVFILAIMGFLLLVPTLSGANQEQDQKSPAEKGAAESSARKIKLEDVVISATRTEKIVQDVPVNASVVTREEIQEQNIKTIDEAINYLEGIYDKRAKGFMDSTQKVCIRGLPGSKRVLVLLDNQPLNIGYTGDVDWSLIPIDSVERIEVIRGPSSALHGGNAMGGVINIITHKPKKLEAWAEYGYGTYNTNIGKIRFGNEWANRFSLFATYEKRKTDGYRTTPVTKTSPATKKPSSTFTIIPVTGVRTSQDEKGAPAYIIGDVGENGWDEDNLHLKFGFRPNDLANLTLGYTYNQSEYSYEDWRLYLRNSSGAPIPLSDPNTYIEFVDTTDGKTKYLKSITEYNFLKGPGVTKHNVFTLNYDHQILDNLQLSLRGGLTDQFENWYITPQSGATKGGGSGQISDTPSTTTTAEVQGDWTGFTNHVLTAGLSNRMEEAENAEYHLTDWRDEGSKDRKTYFAEGKVDSWAIYLQEEWDPIDKISLFAGGRWDNWKARDGRSGQEDPNTHLMNTTSFKERSDNYFSPKLSFLFKPDTQTGIRGSWGKAFRGPNVYELYRKWISSTGTEYRPNPDLDPETTSSWEIGLDQYLTQNSFFRFTYFYNDIEDLIYRATPDPQNSSIKIWQNAGNAVSKGVEFSLNHRIGNDWDYLFNYTYTDATIKKNKALPAIEGKRITGIPENMFNTGLTYHHNKFGGSILGRYVGKTYGSDDNSDTNVGYYKCYDPYFIVNLNLSYKVCKYTDLTLAVDNLFDEEYYQYYQSPGITYTAKLKVGI
ncbi:MAG: TonB-dependent receptor [bacterium]